MSGVKVIRFLLANAAAVTAVVPATRIRAGDLPIDTVLPAIAIEQISSVPQLTLSMTDPNRMHVDRVQVTAFVKGPQGDPSGDGYPGVRTILDLVMAACPNQNGSVNSVTVDSIIVDSEGSDLQDDATSLYYCSRDFIVKWKSPT